MGNKIQFLYNREQKKKNKETIETYFKLHKELRKEKQFNKKVELNIKISKYKKINNIIIIGKEPINEVLINNTLAGEIVWKYAKKDKNLECKHIGYNYKLI